MVDTRLGEVVAELQSSNKEIKSTLAKVNQFVDAASDDSYASAQTTAVILRDTSELLREAREETLPRINAVLDSSAIAVKGMHEETKSLVEKSGKSADALTGTLKQAEALLATLDRQVKEGSPQVVHTVQSLEKLVQDLDKLVDDPAIKGSVANVERATASAAETLETVDIATRPLREKAKLLKSILLKAIGLVKFTVPL